MLSSLPSRGQSLAANPARIDLELFMQAAQDLYDPVDNPEGKFPLNVAENCPMIPIVKEKLDQILADSSIPEWTFQYTATTGHPEVREKVANFLSKHLCGVEVHPDHIGFSAGASAIIEVSSFVLADPGDVAVIPAPSYPMYTKDLGLKSGMERYDLQTHVELADHGIGGPVTTSMLDEALADIQSQGKTFRLLLLSSPDNPTGCVYSEARLRELASWCHDHEIHLVVNEIYGLSTINSGETAREKSFATIMAGMKSPFLHLWYALSKDFAMSGFRFGLVHSLNEDFLTGFSNANIPHMVSNLTQWLVGEMFSDEAFLEEYGALNRERLTRSYQVVTTALDRVGIPYIPAQGSLFVWADFSTFLEEDSDQGQEQLWMDIFHGSGVLLTPGAGFGHQKKGVFRLVHTAIPTDHLSVGMERMVSYLLERKNS